MIVIYVVLAALLCTAGADADSENPGPSVLKAAESDGEGTEEAVFRGKLFSWIARNLARVVFVVAALLGLAQILNRFTGVSIVLTHTKSEEAAASIGRSLVGERLAASANIIKGLGSIPSVQEIGFDKPDFVPLVLQTTRLRMKRLSRRVEELQRDDVPQIIEHPILEGSRHFLAWVREEVHNGPWWQLYWRILRFLRISPKPSERPFHGVGRSRLERRG